MKRTTVRINDTLDESVGHLAHELSVSKAEIMRDAVYYFIQHYQDDLPEHLVKESVHERIKRENNHKMRKMGFKDRVRQSFNEQLEKSHPPRKELIEECYVDSLRREVNEEYEGEYQEEFKEHVESEFERYLLLRTGQEGERMNKAEYQDAVARAVAHAKQSRLDLVVEMAELLANKGRLPFGFTSEKFVQDVREQAKEPWEEQWDKSTKPWKSDE